MRSRIITGVVVAALAVGAPFALAGGKGGGNAGGNPTQKAYICHGTGSATNPYVLLHVPTNSAHFRFHLREGPDLEPGPGGTCTRKKK